VVFDAWHSVAVDARKTKEYFEVSNKYTRHSDAHLRIKRSRFELWPGTLHRVLGQDTLLSQCLSLPMCTNR